MRGNHVAGFVCLTVAAFLAAGCSSGGGTQAEPSASPSTLTKVTVQLDPTAGVSGTSITVTVPECSAGLAAGLAPLSRILLAPEDPTSGGGMVLSGGLARGTFTGDTGTVVVPKSTANGTYWVGVQCPVNLGKATTGGFQLPDGRTADQGFGSAPLQVHSPGA